MTTLGSLKQATAKPLDIPALAIDAANQVITASVGTSLDAFALGSVQAIVAAMTAWTFQDDDAHEPCSLVACRTPLHPGPCKGWKGTLHTVSPHIWKQIEQERVDKANARRTKRIADLKSQGKPIPRKLLAEIKPKPAPGSGASGGHPANGATATPLGKVNQQADLTGGQAHQASQAINKAAGVKTNTAPLPTGPKGKKPTVAGRGPAFVITQPKVTDTYKLDKASKIDQATWDALSPADQKLIRDELEAIKLRGFGPQQTKADQLLAKLSAKPTLGNTSAPPPAQKAPAVPGKVSLGQAVKPVPVKGTTAPSSPAGLAAADVAAKATNGTTSTSDFLKAVDSVGPGALSPVQRDAIGTRLSFIATHPQATDAQKRAAQSQMKRLGVGGTPAAPTSATPQLPAPAPSPTRGTRDGMGVLSKPLPGGAVTSTSVGLPKGYRITRDGMGYSLKHNGKLIRTSATQDSLEKYAKDHAAGDTSGHAPSFNDTQKAATPAAPATAKPTLPSPGPAPAAPKAFSPDVQNARAVAGRAIGGRPTAKGHLDAYSKLSKADFDSLDAATQKTIRDDLANASAKFLDPKKKQEAKDVLNRFGSKHPDPATPPPAGPPPHPKGYSDPQDQAVKNATSGLAVTDDVLKSVARLTPKQVQDLDDADRKAVLTRLAFIATHPKATDAQKEQAAAYGRIVNSGPMATPPATPGQTPSLGELHRHEQATGAPKIAAALDTARTPMVGTTNRDARIKALTGLSKQQFGTLKPDEQREVVNALQALHREKANSLGSTSTLDPEVEKAILSYTGEHPAIHRMKTAEADFRAGKITGDTLHSEFITANVQAPQTTHKAVATLLAQEAARVARDNPTLPMYARARLAGDPVYSVNGGRTYSAITMASMKHNWEDAPRLSPTDIRDLFRATADDLKTVDPLHAQAVKELRENVLRTGLKGQPGVGSPWSTSTRESAVNEFLGIGGGGEIKQDRLDAYNALPDDIRGRVRDTLQDRLQRQPNANQKTDVWLAYRQLIVNPRPLSDDTRNAVKAAANQFSIQGKQDIYRKVDPADFQNLPSFVQDAIAGDLTKLHNRAVGMGEIHDWRSNDDALKVFPQALSAHLFGNRRESTDPIAQNISDIANYGRSIATPDSRVQAYNRMTATGFQTSLSPLTQKDVKDDLTKIENDGSLPLQTRYDAAMNEQVFLRTNSQVTLTPQQLSAVQAADMHPASSYNDQAALQAFHTLNKADYDALTPAFRESIDARLNAMPGPAQQIITARLHPAAVKQMPSGTKPTTGANLPAHVQDALDTVYGVHPKAHTMAHQLSTYGALRGSDFGQLNVQEQNQLLGDLSFIATTAKGPSATKAQKLIDRFTPPGTPSGTIPTPAIIPPANSLPGQVRYAVPQVGTLVQAKDKGKGGDGWVSTPGGKQVWGKYGAAGLMLMHQDPATGEKRYLMVERGPGISDPGKWQFPGGAIDEKESFHQGAAREVIEELGFKADDLKTAAVHGEHTNAIPGSTWKYVSIAAQVPTMLKPDLSTHHARMETSDAKWMTEAEIRALDTSGKLLSPLAGGKLQQNVMSLFPATGAQPGVKLGQVARPGPVTKRQGRLFLPKGGRQAPGSANAYTAPHKPSLGKDLVPDKAAINAMRQKIKNDRKLYDGKTADGRLAAIGAMQGFDDTPTVEGKAEIDRLLATGDYIEVFRGVNGSYGSGGKSAAAINEEMRSGPAYYGKGIFGNGYYLATQRSVAVQYSDHSKGSILRMLIPKSAVTKKYTDVEREAQANSSRSSKAAGGSYELSTFWDPGRWGAAKGLDGIEINPGMRAHGGGGSGHVSAPGKPAFNWLNRSVLIIQKEPG